MNLIKKSNYNKIFMDIGSTLIKYIRFNVLNEITDGGYFYRNYDSVVGNEALDVLLNQLSCR